MKYLTLLFTFFFLLSAMSCCDEEVRLCVNKEGEVCTKGFIFINGNCSCPKTTHFQIGQDLPEDYCAENAGSSGACYEKVNYKDSITNYILYTDCGCTELFIGPDTFIITFLTGRNSDIPYFVKFEDKEDRVLKIKGLTGLGPIGTGLYTSRENEGDSFVLKDISPHRFGEFPSCEPSFEPEITGIVVGMIEGQFNEDDTECDATFYWGLEENGGITIFDSCQWHLRR